MRKHNTTSRQQSAHIEDIVLAVLGLLAGPLLWWMSQSWQQNPAATSVQTLEYWIALLCGILGIGLCTMWGIFLLAGLGLVIATKTKNQLVAYWAALFTPKFLQRLIISVVGIQLTLGPQAFAAEEPPKETAEVASTTTANPFMPELAEMATITESDTHSSPAAQSPNDEDPVPRSSISQEPSTAPTGADYLTKSPQSRQSSEVKSEGISNITVSPDGEDGVVSPTPRQTTTIPVTRKSKQDTDEQDTATSGPTKAYLPRKHVPSPYIAAPNPDRSPEGPTLVVQTGDSLWDIAHQELGVGATPAQIDQRWRQWWQHNTDVIGEDPHSLSPGAILEAPPFTH